MRKLQALGKREAESGLRFLQHLFKNPLTSSAMAIGTMKFSRAGAGKLIERFVELEILKPFGENTRYGKTFIYKKYAAIFSE
jgi:hypothetical protein